MPMRCDDFKILGGAVTFGLIIIALRRKFERKFRH